MDEATKKYILGHLSKLDPHALERLILTVKKSSVAASRAPDPDEFSSRLEYRKAMIERAKKHIGDGDQIRLLETILTLSKGVRLGGGPSQSWLK